MFSSGAGFLRSKRQRRVAYAGVGVAIPSGFYFARSVEFWFRAMPIWLRYKKVGWLKSVGRLSEEEASRRYESLHESQAEAILAAILAMRGAYVKIGQVMSSRTHFPQIRCPQPRP